MKYQIVVARFNEDISYLSFFKDIILVYNKGIDNISNEFNCINLKNVGRESHTYLYHIINNYDKLADKTLFIQANVTDHNMLETIEYFKDEKFIARLVEYPINFLKKKIKHKFQYLKSLKKNDLKRSKYTPYEWLNMIGLNIFNLNNFKMTWGANFCISKDLILSKPKIFYEDLLKYLDYDKNPEEGHFFERSWYLIFNTPFIKKKIIYFDILNNNNYNNYLNEEVKEIHLWNNKFEKYNIKYINVNEYIDFEPIIENNSFELDINIGNLLFLFQLIKIELIFKNDIIEIYYENNLISNCCKNNFIEKYKIKWYNNLFFIVLDNDVILHFLNDNHLILESIKIKANNQFINYNFDNSNIFLFIDDNFNKKFYKDNYENYYIKSIQSTSHQ